MAYISIFLDPLVSFVGYLFQLRDQVFLFGFDGNFFQFMHDSRLFVDLVLKLQLSEMLSQNIVLLQRQKLNRN